MIHTRFAPVAALTVMVCGSARAQFDTVINVPPDEAPSAIESNTQLNLSDGGALPEQFLAGVNPANNRNIEVNISGGNVGIGFRANGGSVVNISGGVVENNYFAREHSTTNVTGGVIDGILTARVDSEVNFRGGAFGDGLTADSGGAIHFYGGDFRLDGALVEGLSMVGDTLPFDLLNNSVLSGILEDGTPFAVTRINSDVFQIGTLTLHAVDLPAIGPAQITASSDPVPLGIRTGQTLNVDAGGAVGNQFNAGLGSTTVVNGGQIGDYYQASGSVIVNSGSIGDRFDALHGSYVQVEGGAIGNFAQAFADSIITLNDGSIGSFFEALTGSVVNIEGGVVSSQGEANAGATINVAGGVLGQRFDANAGSVVNLSAGRLGQRFNANSGSEINVTGGVIDVEFEAFDQSTVNILGGRIRDAFQALEGSNVNLTGTEFVIDGEKIAELVANEPFLVTDRNVVLSGTLADGSTFDFDLNSGFLTGQDFFHTNANIMLHLLPNADFDGNGAVDELDLDQWETAFGVDDGGDADFDGDSDGADFLYWQRQRGSTSAAASIASVPEPTAVSLALCSAIALAIGRRRAAGLR